MAEPDESDFRWLVEGKASRYLARCGEFAGRLVAFAASLRKELSAGRAHLVLEQCELRERARHKFSRAGEMYFTRRLLEQATDEWTAEYKASRSVSDGLWLDLCCGLGGDLIGRARHGPCRGIDRDPAAVWLARANCHAYGLHVEIEQGDAADVEVGSTAAWHIDPDRRPAGQRTTHLEIFQPGLDILRGLLARQPRGAIKLAPATELPPEWDSLAEREWIGSRRECRQQVAWFGDLARPAGGRRATIVARDKPAESIMGKAEHAPAAVRRPGRYLYDPVPVVWAAGLVGSLARQLNLNPLQWELGYLTGEQLVANTFLAVFEVLEDLPYDVRRLRSVLRARQVGRLEVKVRGARVNPSELIRAMRLQGDRALTALVTGPDRELRVVLARRIASSE